MASLIARISSFRMSACTSILQHPLCVVVPGFDLSVMIQPYELVQFLEPSVYSMSSFPFLWSLWRWFLIPASLDPRMVNAEVGSHQFRFVLSSILVSLGMISSRRNLILRGPTPFSPMVDFCSVSLLG